MTRPRDPVHLIVNERAGRGRGAHAGAEARAVLEKRGSKVVASATRGPGDAAVLARRAREEGAAVVAAVGGDGTLHEVANGLLGPELLENGKLDAPVPLLASIPVGSGNDYVKMLGIPRKDPAAAAALILDGEELEVDVGVLEGGGPRDAVQAKPEIFLNNLGLCFTGDANARIEATRGLPGYLAYFVGAVISFCTYRYFPLDLDIDGWKHSSRPTIVHINIGRYCGGGVIFTPEAELSDGLLDVLIMKELSRLGCAIAWKGVTTGQGKHMSCVVQVRGKTVRVHGPAGHLLHADGEVRKSVGTELVVRLVPRALTVLAATAASGARPAPAAALAASPSAPAAR